MLRIKLLLLFCIVPLVVGKAETGFSVGDSVSDLSEYGLTGELPAMDGKVVLIDFWATWCAPCKASFPVMNQVYLENKDRGFEIIAVSVDAKESAINKFLKKRGVDFSVVWDGQKSLVEAAKVSVMPTSLLLDKNGKIRYVHTGWHGKKSESQLMDEVNELLEEEI